MTYRFETLTPNPVWSFKEYSSKETSYITHGYYTYPAKFIPQLVQHLIERYTKRGAIIVDPFMGSGTTVLESMVRGRVGVGVDINELACLVARVKTTYLPSELLNDAKKSIEVRYLKQFKTPKQSPNITLKHVLENERIDFWFSPTVKLHLAVLLQEILTIDAKSVREFYLVCFSQILKTCSIWLQKSVKPTRDFQKKEVQVLAEFNKQANKMIVKNSELGALLDSDSDLLADPKKIDPVGKRLIKCDDARNLPLQAGTADLIVTSPPYVTSYEYADLHQLPLLWLGYLKELASYRKKYIGSAYKDENLTALKSELGTTLVNQLKGRQQRSVRTYFADMLESFYEMKRALKMGGRACIVIGNTRFNGVDIRNAEVFAEQFRNIGFRIDEVICREIPSKMLPSLRDVKTGQFAKTSGRNIKFAYPREYVLIVEKVDV